MTPGRHIRSAGRRHQQRPAHKVATALTVCDVDDAETAKVQYIAGTRWHMPGNGMRCGVIAVTSACAQARPCPAPLSLCCAHSAPRPAHEPILPTRPAMHPPCALSHYTEQRYATAQSQLTSPLQHVRQCCSPAAAHAQACRQQQLAQQRCSPSSTAHTQLQASPPAHTPAAISADASQKRSRCLEVL
jgi:hypothetical protein